jgi:hypothetical protein
MYCWFFSVVIKHMKFAAVFFILNILLLSSFTGTANSHYGKALCWVAKSHAANCKQQKHSAVDDCAKGNCNAMMSCGTCGFVITASVSISPVNSILSTQAVRPFPIGELSDYHGNGWNPPKA